MPADLILTVAVQGILTGLVYGLMALGLSVIFGVVRVVNFAHGEMMTIASYAAIVAFGAWNIDPLVSMIPIAVLLFALGYAMQAVLINPFINRPEHSQFILLAAVAIIMVNGLLMIFGPDARNVLVDYALDSIEVGPLLIDKVRVITAALALLLLAWDMSGLDLPLAHWFGGPAGFPLRDNAFLSGVLHEGAKRLAWVLALLLCVAVWWPVGGFRRLAPLRRFIPAVGGVDLSALVLLLLLQIGLMILG